VHAIPKLSDFVSVISEFEMAMKKGFYDAKERRNDGCFGRKTWKIEFAREKNTETRKNWERSQ
jgi:hypothetical protein